MAKKEETGLAKVTNALDGIELINAQIEALKFIRTTKFKTSGKYEGKDIREIKEVSDLIDIHSSIRLRIEAYEDSAKLLGLKNYKTKTFDNATLEDWSEDIKLQLQVIEFDATLKELEGFKKEYEELMDKNDRIAILNAKIAKKFAK